MKPTFFSSCLVLEPTSSGFSRDRPRFFPFYRLFSFPFSHFESKLRRFSDGTSLFSAPNFNFSSLRPVLPPYFGHFFETSHPLFSQHSPLCTARILFRFGFSLSSSSTPPSYFPLISFPPHNHPTLFTPSPTFLLFPPHFSISLPN